MFRETATWQSKRFASGTSVLNSTSISILVLGTAASLGLAVVEPVYGLAVVGLLLGTAAFPLVMSRPLALLCLLAAFTVTNLTDILIARFGVPSPSKILFFLLLISLAFTAIKEGRWPQVDKPAIILLILTVLSGGVTLFWAYDRMETYYALLDLVRDVLVVVATLAILQTMDDMRAISRVIVAGLTLICVLGILNALLGDYELDFLGTAKFSVEHIAGELDSYRFIGPLTDANAMGRLLLLGIPFAAYEFLGARTLHGRAIALACTASLLTGIVLTFSRGAMIALIVMLTFVVWKHRGQLGRLVLILAPFVLVLTVSLPQSYWDRTEVLLGLGAERTVGAIDTDQSVDNRAEEMLTAVEVFKDHPMLGAGLANYPMLFEKYALDHHFRQRFEPRETHSEILRVAAEKGFLGVGIYLLLWGVCLVSTAKLHAELRTIDARDASLAFSLMLALIGYFAASIVLHEAYSRNAYLILGMALALPQCVRNLMPREGIASGKMRLKP